MMTPEILFSISGAVKRSSLYALLLVSLFSTPMPEKRWPIVPVDSSAARIPLPEAQMSLAVWMSSALNA